MSNTGNAPIIPTGTVPPAGPQPEQTSAPPAPAPAPDTAPAPARGAINDPRCRVSTGTIEVVSGESSKITISDGLEFDLSPGTALVISEHGGSLKIGLVYQT